MAEKENQHTVPATFLRQFEIENYHLPNHVWCVELKNQYSKKPTRKGVNSKIFKRKHFYDVNENDDKLILENFYAEHIEPTYNDIMTEINCEKNLSEQVRVYLIQWIMHSNHRTEYTRDNVARISKWLIEMEQRFNNSKKPKELVSKLSNESIEIESQKIARNAQLSRVLDTMRFEEMIEMYTEELIPKRWMILKTDKHSFIANDNPGFSLNTSNLNRKQIFNPTIHLNHPSFNYLVLSPNHCLFIEPFRKDDPIHLNALNIEIKYQNVSEETVDSINYGTYSTATKYLISHDLESITKWSNIELR